MKWISVEDSLPPVDWVEFDGKRCFSPRLVLIRRLMESRGAARQVVCVGEYDTTGEPAEWRVWDDFVNDQGYEDCDSRVIDDVTHWMEIPDWPDKERELVRCKIGKGTITDRQ